MVDGFKCLNCNKSLLGRAKAKFNRHPLHCGVRCFNTYTKQTEAKVLLEQQWSDFMCGELEKPPKEFHDRAEELGLLKPKQEVKVMTKAEELKALKERLAKRIPKKKAPAKRKRGRPRKKRA